MTAHSKSTRTLLKKYLFTILFLLLVTAAFSQKTIADSLRKSLTAVATDTGRVSVMWNLANAMNKYDPDSALIISQEALYLAQKIGYKEGESKSIGILGNTFLKIGNYTRALELYIQKLKLEEKRKSPRDLASALMNIGIVYRFQKEYRKALEYYGKADSVITQLNVGPLKYNIVLNLGDVYDLLDRSDSALMYFNKSLELANKPEDYKSPEDYKKSNKPDDYKIGKSLTGLGHSYRKLESYQQSLINYQNSFAYLQAANDDETYCESMLGLAELYRLMKKSDSSLYYAKQSLSLAKKDGLVPLELEAAEFLVEHYKEKRNIDSAFAYINKVHDLNDSVNNNSQIRQLQVLSSDEQFRQLELKESRRIAKVERSQQLQMLLIAIFIPGLFLITLLLSRVKLHLQAIRLLGVLSLLFFFEYLTLLLHPTVANLTNHTPVYEILIFVALAAVFIPAHHRLEHWLIHRLIHHRVHHADHDKEQSESKIKSPA
jgi:tetratricopeptide (TPR) repeat protein